jgi:predicted nucleotidyltransferase component of viral defense system
LIARQEILEFSREFGLRIDIVEKNYVLGWLLAGISNHSELGSAWVFKGGTCLRKCYFETYRFSEDLDFTITDSSHLDQEFLIKTFRDIADWVYELTGIEMPHEFIRFDIYTNPRGKLSGEGRVGYRGSLQPHHDLPRMKLDWTNDEILVLKPEIRELHHPYSDRPEEGIHVQCYSFEELFAEKIRALAERLRPRDLYDVVHLFRHGDERKDRALILSTLEKKCEFKSIPVPTIESLQSNLKRPELEAEWENMLGHQLPILPPFEQFWHELPALFEWLHRAVEKVAPSRIPLMGIPVDETWHPPAMARAWHANTPLEIIRFAAANHLCVDLGYSGTHRLIEPYALRMTREGNLLLYAVKHTTGEDRSYRVDRIQAANVTKIPFTPRYFVELTASGPVSIPPTTRKEIGPRGVRPVKIMFSRRSSRKVSSDFGPKYVFQCSVCGKQFTHKSYDASLNPHKDKQGFPCYGRYGMYITTKY